MARDDRPVVLEAPEYEQGRQALMADPIIQDMAHGVAHMDRAELAHPDGGPRHEFMLAAGREYRVRGGTVDYRGMGAPATAILRLLDQWRHIDAEVERDGPARQAGHGDYLTTHATSDHDR